MHPYFAITQQTIAFGTESLQTFGAEEDHVAAIQHFFLKGLEIVKEVKERSPELRPRCGEAVDDSLPEKLQQPVLSTAIL